MRNLDLGPTLNVHTHQVPQKNWVGISFGEALEACLGLVKTRCPGNAVCKDFMAALGVKSATLASWRSDEPIWDDHYKQMLTIFPSLATATAPKLDSLGRLIKPGRTQIVIKKALPSYLVRAQVALGL